MATWNNAAKARTDFADMIDSLSEAQLNEQSLCAQWTAEGVLAHVTSFVETNAIGMFRFMAKAKFDFDKVSVLMANEQLKRPSAELVATLRAKASKSAPLPMFPEELTVGDLVIHTQDVRRPLGLDGELDEGLLRGNLTFLTTHKMATTLVNRRSIDGVKLVATDLGWSFGSGPEITGTGEAIMMALADRPVLGDLSGDGLTNWS